MTLEAQVSGVPAYSLQVTDSSLFVFSNLNLDTRSIGSVSNANVLLPALSLTRPRMIRRRKPSRPPVRSSVWYGRYESAAP